MSCAFYCIESYVYSHTLHTKHAQVRVRVSESLVHSTALGTGTFFCFGKDEVGRQALKKAVVAG